MLVLSILAGCANPLILPEEKFSVSDVMDDGKDDGYGVYQYLPYPTSKNLIPEIMHAYTARTTAKVKRLKQYAMARFELTSKVLKKPVKNAKLLIHLFTINDINPKYRKFDIFLYQSTSNQIFDEIKQPSIYIGNMEITAHDELDIEIDITDILNDYITKKIIGLGVKVEPVGPVPHTGVDVYAIEITR